MHRIAIFGDIHGNVPALEAVLADLATLAVDEVLVSGDLVGRGPQGTAVVERVRETGWRGVRGNHEDYTLAFKRGNIEDAWRTEEAWAASRWMGAELSDEAADWAEALPLALRSRIRPSLYLTHGTPTSNRDGLMPETSDDELTRHLDHVGHPILLCGHTHRPMHRRVGHRHVINVGSVGLPFNGDTRAQYAVVHVDDDDLQVEFRKVEYDRERFLAHYRTSGFLEEGGITSVLLADEVRTARPCLVPFLTWAKFTGRPATLESLPRFRELFHPGMSISEMLAVMRREMS